MGNDSPCVCSSCRRNEVSILSLARAQWLKILLLQTSHVHPRLLSCRVSFNFEIITFRGRGPGQICFDERFLCVFRQFLGRRNRTIKGNQNKHVSMLHTWLIPMHHCAFENIFDGWVQGQGLSTILRPDLFRSRPAEFIGSVPAFKISLDVFRAGPMSAFYIQAGGNRSAWPLAWT